jgi:ADP-ribose pyrophosphatase
VTRSLSEHQRNALTLYYSLLRNSPQLFSGRSRRPIVREPGILEEFAETHRVVLGVAAQTPYLWLVNDLVQSRDISGTAFYHPYLRLIAPPERAGTHGVVALATVHSGDIQLEESIVLVEQERHATGTVELELPRGFGNPSASPEVHAVEELRTETGYVGEYAEYLGTTLTDSGTTDSSVSFFHVPVTGHAPQTPEPQEAIFRVVLLTREELWSRITSGAIRDAFTVQALALYERRFATKETHNI